MEQQQDDRVRMRQVTRAMLDAAMAHDDLTAAHAYLTGYRERGGDVAEMWSMIRELHPQVPSLKELMAFDRSMGGRQAPTPTE